MTLRSLQVMLMVFLGMTTAGCELVGNIFQAGMWVGVIMVVLVLLVVGFIVSKIRR